MTTTSLVPLGTGISGGGGSPTTSFFSSITGPSLSARSWTWTTAYTAVTVGTVLVTVDENTNQTETTTVYNTQHVQYVTDGSFNGSLLHSRTDVDAQGTVTSVVYDGDIGSSVTLTYPTNYLDIAGSSLTWDAILPTFTANASCCHPTTTLAPTPAQMVITTPTASTLSDDPSGWLYDLVPVSIFPNEVSEIWSGQTLGLDYSGCAFTMCPGISSSSTTPIPASYTWQNPQAYLLATSTTTLSSVASDGNGGGGGTTMPQPGNQGPPGVTTTPTAVPDRNSQDGNGPTSSPDGDMPSGGTSDVVPTQQQQPPPSGNGQPPSMNMPPPIVIGPATITPNSASQYVVGDQTLAPGSAIEVSGTSYSLPSGGSQVVVGTVTSDLMPGVTSPPSGSLRAVTWAGSVVTPNSNSEYVIDGRTLVAGSAITVSGTPVSLPSGGSQLVVGDVTSSASPGPSIMSSAASGPQSSSSSPSSSSAPASSDQSAASRGAVAVSFGKIAVFLTALMFLTS